MRASLPPLAAGWERDGDPMMLFWLFNRRSRTPGRPVETGAGLRMCPSCRSDYVVPVDHRVADDDHWWMRLRCGECGSAREVTVTNDDAQRYDRALSKGMAVITRVAEKLDRESMEHEFTTLISALRHDLIDASDFAGGSTSAEWRIE
jgi:hypothetical protein